MKPIRHLWPVGLALLLAISTEGLAAPITISYELTSFGGGRYRYDYDVTNVSWVEPVREFTIWFGHASYANLLLATPNPPSADWDELVIEPTPSLHDDGFYDARELSGGITVGTHVQGFAVEFDWLSNGDPGSQPFDVVDPVTFDTQYSDFTVPEPATLVMLAVGLAFVRRLR